MAAIVHGIDNATTTNAETYAFTAFTPAAGDLIVAMARAGATAVAGDMTSDVGITFTKLDHVLYNASGARVYVFVANEFATAVSTTLTFTCTGDAADGCVRMAARVSGMSRTGLAAVRQYKKQENAAAGTPAPAFDAACLTTNPTIACMGNLSNPAGMTQPSGWTERADSGHTNPTSGGYYASRDSGFTGTTVTWGSASATDFGAMIIELDASAAAEVPPPILVTARGRT